MSDLVQNHVELGRVPKNVQRAVLIHGPLQSLPDTLTSFERFVTGANGTPVFHFGPYPHPTVESALALENVLDAKTGPRRRPTDTSPLLARYGERLTGYDLHHVPQSRFAEDAKSLVAEARRLPGSNPADLLARFYHMEGAIDLLRAWEKNVEHRVQQVVLVRSDLAYYSPIDAQVATGEIGIPTTEGFNATTGQPNKDVRKLRYFRNRLTGDLVLGGDCQTFNGDILALHREDVDRLDGVYDKAVDLLAEGAPPHLETILHLILVGRLGLRIRTQSRWLYEICRPGEPNVLAASDGKEAVRRGGLALLPDRMMARTSHGGTRERVAVLLYGMLRNYTSTAGSLLQNVVKPNEAAVFYYGPTQTDQPTRANGGSFDQNGFFLSNPKGNLDPLQPVREVNLKEVYGASLKRAGFHDTLQDYFVQVSESIFSRDDWMFMLSPHRLLSMFYNMTGAVKLLRDYEEEVGYEFDQIIITRPDLAFYTQVIPHVNAGELHIVSGEGFDPNGRPNEGNAPVYFYKNVSTGAYAPAGRRFSFNDQVFVLNRSDLVHFYDVYDQLVDALRSRVPGSPETIFYLLMVQSAGLSLIEHPEWMIEIFRADDPIIKGVNDTADILHIDPHSVKAVALRRLQSPEPPPPPPPELPPELPPPLPPQPEPGPVIPAPVAVQADGARLLRDLLEASGHPGWWATARSRLLLKKARRLRRSGNVRAAEHFYARMLRLTPHVQREWVQYGHALKDQGDWRAAISAYEFALLLKPGDPDATLHHQSAINHVAAAG